MSAIATPPLHDEVCWIEDTQEIAAVSYDRSGWSPVVHPSLLARVSGVAGVQHVVRYAQQGAIPLVVRGAGSGLAGGAVATDGALLLDLSGLSGPPQIHAEDEIAQVAAGVIVADLDRAAAAYGLRYAPDPASVELATIGGTLATNAGGLRCAKYGVTRDAVLGLDVVLADGSLIHTGRGTIKGVTGYDLTGLFVGSEGTLGVIVGATLRLRPLPATTVTIAAYCADAATAFSAVAAVRAAGVVPAVAEFIDGATLARIDEHTGSSLAADGGAFLLLQTDGLPAAARAEAQVATEQLRRFTDRVEQTDDPDRAAELIAVRRAALPALEQTGQVLIEDICVPRSKLTQAVARIEQVSAQTAVPVYTFAHAGDGNLHPIVVVPHGLTVADPQVQAAADAIFAIALDLGGTITGEHGVGALKREWMYRELGQDVVGLQRRIKAAIDPAGILNPGRAL